MSNAVWPTEKRDRLLELVAKGLNAAEVGVELGRSHYSIISYCNRNGIAIVNYTAEQRAVFDARAKERQRLADVRKVERNRAKRIAARKAVIEAAESSGVLVPAVKPKLTVHELRAKFPMPINPTKTELQAMLRQAVLNTAALQSSEASA